MAEAVYGLPEINRDAIAKARLIANPGCYPTAVTLGFLPLVEGGHVDASKLIADTKSGVSGAGRKSSTKLLWRVLRLVGRTTCPVIGIAPEISQTLFWRREEMSGSPLCLI